MQDTPEQARFDYQVFEEWFIYLMHPVLERQKEPNAIIGENLSSHLNVKVLLKNTNLVVLDL